MMLSEQVKDDAVLFPPIVRDQKAPVLSAPGNVRLVRALLWGCLDVANCQSVDFHGAKRFRDG